MLAVGAGGYCLDIFLSSFLSLSFPLSLGDGPIYTEIVSQRDVKPKTTNQPSSRASDMIRSRKICLMICLQMIANTVSSLLFYYYSFFFFFFFLLTL